jgi:hypothetical protein
MSTAMAWQWPWETTVKTSIKKSQLGTMLNNANFKLLSVSSRTATFNVNGGLWVKNGVTIDAGTLEINGTDIRATILSLQEKITSLEAKITSMEANITDIDAEYYHSGNLDDHIYHSGNIDASNVDEYIEDYIEKNHDHT